MTTKAVRQYLARHAEPEAGEVSWCGPAVEHVVCIPACREDQSLLQTLRALSRVTDAERALALVVVNGGVSAGPEVHQSNERCWEEIRRAAGLGSGEAAWGSLNGLRVLAIDRYSPGRRLPEKQGVGLARKIAGDLALRFSDSGQIRSDWILCTDAAVELPEDYLQRSASIAPSSSAVLFPFMHVPEGDALQAQAIALYEEFLNYYVEGLRFAGSPYAFHTIGSLIGIRATAYAAVRGFPKREAGEDFYLLNKLAKVGEVTQLSGQPVRIRGRVSSRVPFGTGAAVLKIRDRLLRGQAYTVMAPEVFEGLRSWLAALRTFSVAGDVVSLRDALARADGDLLQVVEDLGGVRAAEAAASQVSGVQLARRLTEWNDAFRTLKLLHALRDQGAGELPLDDAASVLADMKHRARP